MVRCTAPSGAGTIPMARKKLEPIDDETARTIGGLLRGLRRAAGYRAVRDAAAAPECPAASQTIYAYERGGLVPSLKHFMELAEFFAMSPRNSLSEADRNDLRYQAVAAIIRVLTLPAYGFTDAFSLIERLQPAPPRGRRRAASA
jgi:DNA-binding XRE family transcriptional regulator